MYIDTHTHIYDQVFDNDRRETVERALAAGIEMMILPNIDLGSIAPMRRLHTDYPACTRMAMGLHPTEVKSSYREDLSVIGEELRRNRDDYVAIGEVGIDLYWDKSMDSEQYDAFRYQLILANEMELPVLIHCRDGLDLTLEAIASIGKKPVTIFHSFGGSTADVDHILQVAPESYFGINGIVTFKNSGLRQVIPHIDRSRLLLETDSPYLAPVPKRGKRNETAYIPLIAAAIADALGTTTEEVGYLTSENARRIFNF
ncbi:MAG: TatD family hydrolase [Muribaculaceae bacterium]|nr:TatD family hydrolase [Muribaculaceae bacterium]